MVSCHLAVKLVPLSPGPIDFWLFVAVAICKKQKIDKGAYGTSCWRAPGRELAKQPQREAHGGTHTHTHTARACKKKRYEFAPEALTHCEAGKTTLLLLVNLKGRSLKLILHLIFESVKA